MTERNDQKLKPAQTARALGLCSGGLDSILSALLLRRQGIDVTWISFETPFFNADKARLASEHNRIPLIVRDITPEYLEMLKNPRAGFGKNMNPCMDCHALMFRTAGEYMRTRGYDFIFSGEVLGQRPMSQNAPSLNYVAKHSGIGPAILRPLSALKLPPTPMENDGLVNRAELLGLYGRSRKPQIELARQWGVTDYPAPAGGCLLTDKGFASRLADLLAQRPDCRKNDLDLLRYGRHLRLGPQVKLIVGRTQKDNEAILRHADPNSSLILSVTGYPGPTGLLPADTDPAAVETAAAVCAGYTKAPRDRQVVVLVQGPGSRSTVTVAPLSPDQSRTMMI